MMPWYWLTEVEGDGGDDPFCVAPFASAVEADEAAAHAQGLADQLRERTGLILFYRVAPDDAARSFAGWYPPDDMDRVTPTEIDDPIEDQYADYAE